MFKPKPGTERPSADTPTYTVTLTERQAKQLGGKAAPATCYIDEENGERRFMTWIHQDGERLSGWVGVEATDEQYAVVYAQGYRRPGLSNKSTGRSTT